MKTIARRLNLRGLRRLEISMGFAQTGLHLALASILVFSASLTPAIGQAADKTRCPRKDDWPWQRDRTHLDDAINALAQKDFGAALKAALAISKPDYLIAMAADRRFDPLASQLPHLSDLSGAAIDSLFQAERLATDCPRSLQAQLQWQVQLLDLGEFEQANRIAVRIQLAIRQTGVSAFNDTRANFGRVRRMVPTALVGLKALDQATEAHATNLGIWADAYDRFAWKLDYARFLIMVEKPMKAQRQIETALPVIPFASIGLGSVVEAEMRLIRLDIALQNHDQAAQETWLRTLEMSKHRSPDRYQCALVHANQLDRAAAWLAERLRNPRLRADALMSVQDYSSYDANSEWSRQLAARWRQLYDRPDVKTAVQEVGRVARYGFLWRPTWHCHWAR